MSNERRGPYVLDFTGAEPGMVPTYDPDAANGITWATADGVGGGGGTGDPAGSDGAVQFNDAGALGGDDTVFAWDNTNARLRLGGPDFSVADAAFGAQLLLQRDTAGGELDNVLALSNTTDGGKITFIASPDSFTGPTAPDAGDTLGQFGAMSYVGAPGGYYDYAAAVRFVADVAGNGVAVPGRVSILTADASDNLIEALRVDSNQVTTVMGRAVVAQGEITSDVNALTISSTWNNAAEDFHGLVINVTRTALGNTLDSRVFQINLDGNEYVWVHAGGAIYGGEYNCAAPNALTNPLKVIGVSDPGATPSNETGDFFIVYNSGTDAFGATTGPDSIFIGQNAGAWFGGGWTGTSNTVIGHSAGGTASTGGRNSLYGSVAGNHMSDASNDNTLIGYASGGNVGNVSASSGSTIVGASAGVTLTTGGSCLVLGYQADVAAGATTSAISLAGLAAATNDMVIGGANSVSITNAYVGKGKAHATPVAVAVQATGGSGSNIAGADLTVAAGKSTGSATASVLHLATGTVGASSSTLQTLTNRCDVDGLGGIILPEEYANGADPTGPTSGGRLFMIQTAGNKTQFAVRFPSGATQIIATEP